MDTLMQSQIFFFISSIGFIILFILAAISLIYLIRFMASSSRIMDKIEKGVGSISDSTKDIISDIGESMAFKFLFGKKKKRKK